MFTKILVPVDGSDHAERAAAVAGDLAAKYGAALEVLHVLLHGPVPEAVRRLSDKPGPAEPAMACGAGYVDASPPREVLEDIGDKVLERARRIAAEHGAEDVHVERTEGEPAERILETAGEIGADTIVMGSRGLGRLRGLLVGSVSHKVQHLFDGTVVTVR